MVHVTVFIASGIIVVLAGTALARYADAIAEATKLGRLWIGSILLAGATSLPELVTDVTAVRLGAVDLAVGDLFGSSMANMLILSVIDLVPPRGRVLQKAAFDHALAATLAIMLNALAAVFILMRPEFTILSVGPASILLCLVYVFGTRVVFRHVTRAELIVPDAVVPSVETKETPPSLRHAVSGFAIASIVVLGSAPAFAWSAKGIAEMTGLGDTFVGTWLVGLTTSMPELVASYAAVRIGAFDMAVGNLFGSNALNMAVFLPLDIAHPGSVFAAADPNHAISALFAVVLMSLGLAAIVYRAKRRIAVVEPDSVLMLIVYAFALWLLYRHTAGA
ncbi:MAG: hypothetical protein L6Q71_00045 [Planctomycetes bacterium]|nr:hypothetical protein [Planctomycetota bacterium]NUQ33879.1 sodium:calcium antiporter [Planctomycetaceae bacterium]